MTNGFRSRVLALSLFSLFFTFNAFAVPEMCRLEPTTDPEHPQVLQAIFERVVDGDTIKFNYNGEHNSVRFLGIDTPEKNYLGKNQGQWANAATDHLHQLSPRPGSVIYLELGMQGVCDQYGRLLAHVWNGEKNLNFEMVKDGYAVNYCIYPNLKYCDVYGKWANYNQANGIGIFSDPSLEIPYEWRRQVSHRPYEKYVGDITTFQVYDPASVDRVNLGNRVFFFRAQDIQAPFFRVE